ncbi:MAG: flagellar motor protein MotB [Bosea sp. (in: a-proteobacteria)]
MEEDRQEPIIVRRSAGRQKDQLKGGVWKIAHADFMTAMMALFLVLWLVNSANRETRTSVAQYFNPIRLSDATTDRKGIRNPQDVKTGDRDSIYLHDGEGEAEANPAAEAAGAISQAARLKRAETGKGALDDPYRLLAEATPASADPAAEPARPALAAGGPGKPGLTGSEVLRDPFDPEFWRQAALAGATAKPSDQPDETAPVAPKSAGAPDETAQGETTALGRTALGKMAPAPG